MPYTDLQPFVDAAKARGAGDEFLTGLLGRRGWPAADIDLALGDWWERATGVKVPGRGSAGENARDAFLYLLAFSTLATWACALGSLWFRLIERWLPDSVAPAMWSFRSMVTWQMASIAVALPIYLWVMQVILRETRANPDRVESGVRKWLTYIALLLAAIGVVSDLVCFVQYFLAGGLTLRFVLKCAVVFAICGSIFWYYLGFLRGRSRSRGFAGLAVAAAALGFFLGLTAAGTPSVQRGMEADIRRVQDLRNLAYAISAMPALPASIESFAATRPNQRLKDPETQTLYEYSIKSPTKYELCANFAAADEQGTGFWSHSPGRGCFDLEGGGQVPY